MKGSRVSPSHQYVDITVTFMARVGNDCVKLCDFLDQRWVVYRQVATQLSQDIDGLSSAVVGDEPSIELVRRISAQVT